MREVGQETEEDNSEKKYARVPSNRVPQNFKEFNHERRASRT